MTGGIRYAAAAVAVLLVVGLSGRAGYRVAAGECAERELEVARAYVSNQDAAVAAVRGEAEAAAGRVAELRRKHGAALSRAEGLERELANLPRRAECDLDAGELRALTELHGALFAEPVPSSGGVQGRLPVAADAQQPAAGLRETDAALGLHMLGAAR